MESLNIFYVHPEKNYTNACRYCSHSPPPLHLTHTGKASSFVWYTTSESVWLTWLLLVHVSEYFYHSSLFHMSVIWPDPFAPSAFLLPCRYSSLSPFVSLLKKKPKQKNNIPLPPFPDPVSTFDAQPFHSHCFSLCLPVSHSGFHVSLRFGPCLCFLPGFCPIFCPLGPVPCCSLALPLPPSLLTATFVSHVLALLASLPSFELIVSDW